MSPMTITRRHFLRAAGISMALPVLEYFQPRGLAAIGRHPIRRMVCICTPLGLHAPYFFPEQPGKDYTPSPYLDLLKEHCDDFSVISGLAHPDVGARMHLAADPAHVFLFDSASGARL